MQAVAAQDSLIGGTLIDKYKIVRQIGRGGMGVVYEAEHIELGKRVAIKLMLEKYADDGEAIARFKREALAASRIGNPHIIDVGDIGTAPDGRSFVVMELLIGCSLADLIEKTGPMPPPRAISIMRQVLRAVGAAHAKGIIHRDLKPDNIFLVDQGDHQDFVKLLDFGISKIVDQAAEIAATKLTTTGMVMGTPLYMAPEQAMGAITDLQADIYALGVILYEMLAGHPPFNGVNYAVLVAKLLTADPPILSDVRPGLPPALVAAVHRALEKEPTSRFANCEAFATALPSDRPPSGLELAHTMGSGSVVAAVRPRTLTPTPGQAAPAPKRSRLPIVFGAVGAGLAVGSVAIILLSRSADAPTTNKPIVEPIETPKAVEAVTLGSGSLTPGVPTGRLLIRTMPTGATVSIDGKVIGPAAIEIIENPGKHHVHVELAGYISIDEDDEIQANERNSVTITLQKADDIGSAKPLPIPGKVGPRPAVKTVIRPQVLPHVEPIPPGGLPPPEVKQPEVKQPEVKRPEVKPPEAKKPPPGLNSKPNPYH